MTTQEFNLEFDLLYSNNANVGPGLDDYDKSVFLTIAQEELVNNYYSPKSNFKREGFEESEKRRRDLEKIAIPAIATSPTQNSFGLSSKSYNFIIENNVKFIVNERIKVSSASDCLNGFIMKVTPTTHDEYNINKDNPFKAPSKEEAWRIDISSPNNRIVEIITHADVTPTEYHYRYIKTPKPIILNNLTSGLTINGISVQTECELQSIAREILHRAVEIALEVSGNPRYQSKVQLDTRNE
jgi:hypothetical protein